MQHFMGTYGYVAIFILMVAESACIPISSELTMPLGGAMAAGAAAPSSVTGKSAMDNHAGPDRAAGDADADELSFRRAG